MVEGLLELNLLLTNALLFYIVIHCYQFKGNSAQFVSNLNTRLDALSEEVQEGGHVSNILLDIADLIEDSGVSGVKTANAPTGASMPEIILGALMNRTAMSASHGETKNEIGEIHEEEFIPEAQPMEERN